MPLLFLAAFSLLASSSLATAAENVEHFSVGAGAFNLFDNDDVSTQFSGEYRGEYLWEGLRPVVGVSVNTDGGVYGYGGANYDVNLGENWVLTPNFMVGAYHRGDSRDLGHTLEFRSGLELDYSLGNNGRIGAAFNHISNASLGDKNPGAESLMLVYSHPIHFWGNQ